MSASFEVGLLFLTPQESYQFGLDSDWFLRPIASLGEVQHWMHQMVCDACAQPGLTHEPQWWGPDTSLNLV